MANEFNLTQAVTKANLSHFKYEAPFIATIKDESKNLGGVATNLQKVGFSTQIPKPVRMRATGTGLDASLDVQDISQDVVDFSLTSYSKVHTAVPTLDEAYKLENTRDIILNPSAIAMVAHKETDHSKVINQVGHVVLAGTGGADIQDIGLVNVLMNEAGVPYGQRNFLCSSSIQDNIVNGVANLFHPAPVIKRGFYEGDIKSAKNLAWMQSEYLPILTLGDANNGSFDSATGVTPLGEVVGTIVDGATTVVIDNIASGTTIKAGTILQFENVGAINELSFAETGRLRRFAVKFDATVTTNSATVTLTETLWDNTTTKQTVTNLPANDAVVSFIGEASAKYKQGIAYVQDTFLQAFGKLVKPNSREFSMLSQNGIIMRTIMDYSSGVEGNTYADNNIIRCDSVSGVSGGRLEMGVRLLEKIG